jgi:hypothetical protein
MVVMGEDTRRDLWISHLTCCGLSQHERSPHTGLLVGSIHVAYVNWHENRVCHVYQVSPVGCTSYEPFVVLFTHLDLTVTPKHRVCNR